MERDPSTGSGSGYTTEDRKEWARGVQEVRLAYQAFKTNMTAKDSGALLSLRDFAPIFDTLDPTGSHLRNNARDATILEIQSRLFLRRSEVYMNEATSYFIGTVCLAIVAAGPNASEDVVQEFYTALQLS